MALHNLVLMQYKVVLELALVHCMVSVVEEVSFVFDCYNLASEVDRAVVYGPDKPVLWKCRILKVVDLVWPCDNFVAVPLEVHIVAFVVEHSSVLVLLLGRSFA
jgi:hypothetical protein